MAHRLLDPSIRGTYLDWLLRPPGMREPSTKTAFAAAHDVSLRTLHNWERDTEFQDALAQLRREWGTAFHGDILERLMRVVSEGKDSDAIAAARVLLGHLDLGVKDEKAVAVDKRAIAVALSELGFDVRD